MSPIIQHIRERWWAYILGLFTFVAVFHKFIANDLPVLGQLNGNVMCPVCHEYLYAINWKTENPRNFQYESILSPPIKYSPYAISYSESNIPPFKGTHYLGTDTLGRDLMAGLVYGSWKAFIVGIFAIAIAFLIALVIGSTAGYYKNERIETGIVNVVISGILFFIAVFYFIIERQGQNSVRGIFFFGLIIVVLILFNYYFDNLGKKLVVKPDLWADKIIEIREVIPGIFLVLASLSLFSTASIWNVVLVIGFISWSNMARFIRAEILRVKSQSYFLAAKSMGLSDFRLIVKHIIPNAIDPIFATVAFAISSAILLEASLSFLGIGVPPQEITWGALLAEARKTNQWWLAIFPGLCIFLVLIALQAYADKLRKRHY